MSSAAGDVSGDVTGADGEIDSSVGLIYLPPALLRQVVAYPLGGTVYGI